MHVFSCKIYPLSHTNKDKFSLYIFAPSNGISLKHSVPLINLYFLLSSISRHNPQCVPFDINIEVSHCEFETQISSGIKFIFSLSQFLFISTHLLPSTSKIIF